MSHIRRLRPEFLFLYRRHQYRPHSGSNSLSRTEEHSARLFGYRNPVALRSEIGAADFGSVLDFEGVTTVSILTEVSDVFLSFFRDRERILKPAFHPTPPPPGGKQSLKIRL